MNKFFESGFMKGLNKFGQKLSNNKGFSAIQQGMMSLMGVILVGAIFQIISLVPTLFGWFESGSTIYNILYAPYNFTMNMLSVWMVFLMAYSYANSLKMKPILNAVNAVIIFLLVSAPIDTYVLADGSSVTALNTANLGGVGLFVAIIVALCTVRFTKFLLDHNVSIKLPDVVPPFLSEGFNALLPLLLNVIVWHGLGTIISMTTAMTLPDLINYILGIPLGYLNSVPGMILIGMFACLLWTFGIHGTMIAISVVMALLIQATTHNADLVAQGLDPVFSPVFLFGTIAICGGTGNTLGLAIMGLRSKSKQIKAVAKAGIVPGIFNINEPLTFGLPIMYNPILSIPYVLNPVIVAILAYIGYSTGFLVPPYILIMSLMPIGVAEFMGTLSWTNSLFTFLMIIVTSLIYLPFFKVYEKQLVEKEKLAEAKEAE